MEIDNSPLVSITMSTYNVEDFLKDSLESIVNQTYRNLEIIIIDDGSTDLTVSTLKSYALNDERIKLVLKDANAGLAAARNDALRLATGKYITFFDGDDIYDKCLIDKAVSLAENKNSDLVIWDFQIFSKGSELMKWKHKSSKLSHIDVSDKLALLQIPAFTWIKLLKTQKVRELNIYFPEGKTRQDIPVHWHLITALDKITILPEILSYYRQQPEATTYQNDRRMFDLAYVMDITKEHLKKQGFYEFYKTQFIKQRLDLLFGMYDRVKKELKSEALEIIDERFLDEERQYVYGRGDLRIQARWFFRWRCGDFSSLIMYHSWIAVRYFYRMLKSR